MITATNGILLIAEPFLKDPSFTRSVVLVCKHSADYGTFGFTLNKKIRTTLSDVMEDMEGWKIPIFLGGPMQKDTLHYIHQYPQYFTDAVEVADGIYWGGNFETLKTLIKNGTIEPSKVKFFLGYSGWDPTQLDEELLENTWIMCQANTSLVFDTKPSTVWNASLTQLGGKYKMMVNFPKDPQLN
jgi:putative transcriptional regulator